MLAALCGVAAVCAQPATALAQDAAESPAASKRAAGKAALEAGRTAEACQAFEDALALAKKGDALYDDLLFDSAECHAKLGKNQVAAGELDLVEGARRADAQKRAGELRGGGQPATAVGEGAPTTPPPASDGKPADGKAAEGDKPKEVTSPAPGGTRLSDFIDTRLTWVFGDDDVLHSTGQAFPLSPDASLGDRKQYRLFFDNLNSRFAGRENLTHLVLYKKLPSFVRNLDTEASMVLRLDVGALSRNTNNLNQAFYDSGSYLRAFYHTDGTKDGTEGVGLTLYVLDTDRLRLGWLYDISWGGTNPFINQSIFPRIQGASPGAKLQYDSKVASAWIAFKTAQIVQVEETLTPGTAEVEQIRVAQTNYGVLGGGTVNIGDYFNFDLGAGYFTQGKFDLPDVEGLPIYTFGFSGRAHVHHPDMKSAQSIDFQLYRNDPMKQQVFFRPEKYQPGKTLWAVSAEFSQLFQHLKDFDNAGATALQSARAAALQGQVKSGFFRASLTGIYRDLAYVLRNQPSYIPFQTIPLNSQVGDEIFAAAAVDYHIPEARLTPTLGLGVQVPATFSTSSLDASNAPINRTVVVREQGNIAILPIGRSSVPIIQARLSLRFDVSEMLGAMAWIQYTRDNNGTFVERNPDEGTVALRSFVAPDFLGFGTSVQARF
jgi:hypothetical protein